MISRAVKAGQNVYHAIKANKLSVSKPSVYRYINSGYYSISRLDLPRAVKFKPRKQKRVDYVPKGIRIGRQYSDFVDYMQLYPSINSVEMDTLIGTIGGKVIMTFQLVNVDFMFGILLDNRSPDEAASRITLLKEKLLDANMNCIPFVRDVV